VIGVNAAMHALGVLAIALALPRLVPRIGARRMTLGALVLAGVVLALFPAVFGIWLWFPLRLMMTLVGSRFDGADLASTR
jgi:dolichyl-phosphate-mannose--protein O-mannosyl transferase